jgi:hypothetical protein
MAQGIIVEGSPAGWRYDSSTKQTRWWDGRDWTDFTPPPAPVSAYGGGSSSSSVQTLHETRPSRNGAAAGALVLIGVAALGLAATLWLVADPVMALAIGGAVALTLVLAFVLGVVGLAAAIRRSTTKGASLFALIASAVLLMGLIAAAASSLNQLALASL